MLASCSLCLGSGKTALSFLHGNLCGVLCLALLALGGRTLFSLVTGDSDTESGVSGECITSAHCPSAGRSHGSALNALGRERRLASPGGGVDVQVSVRGGLQAASWPSLCPWASWWSRPWGLCLTVERLSSLSSKGSVTLEFPTLLWPLLSEVLLTVCPVNDTTLPCSRPVLLGHRPPHPISM